MIEHSICLDTNLPYRKPTKTHDLKQLGPMCCYKVNGTSITCEYCPPMIDKI
jgi:hypothetical protein